MLIHESRDQTRPLWILVSSIGHDIDIITVYIKPDGALPIRPM